MARKGSTGVTAFLLPIGAGCAPASATRSEYLQLVRLSSACSGVSVLALIHVLLGAMPSIVCWRMHSTTAAFICSVVIG